MIKLKVVGKSVIFQPPLGRRPRLGMGSAAQEMTKFSMVGKFVFCHLPLRRPP